jgi:lipid A 3-O-deacylase
MLVIACTMSAQAAGTLVGSVFDQTGAPIANAQVSAQLQDRLVFHGGTNGEGKFSFNGIEGQYLVSVRFPGFISIEASALPFSDSASPRIVMQVAPTPCDPSCGPLEQSSPVAQAAKAKWEYGAFFNGGVGLEDRTNFTFLSAGAQLGRILTPELGTGLLKGNFEYAVQVIPYWQSFTPKFPVLKCPAGATSTASCYGPVTAGGTYHGASIEPIIVRYNFTHGKKIMPWIQAAGGVLYTTRKYPAIGNTNYADATQTGPNADTSVWNFTPQGGVGAHYFLKPGRSMDLSLNGVHISSASLGDKNPGVNVSLQCSIGYTWWK